MERLHTDKYIKIKRPHRDDEAYGGVERLGLTSALMGNSDYPLQRLGLNA